MARQDGHGPWPNCTGVADSCANEAQFERHNQNSKPDLPESEPASKKDRAAGRQPDQETGLRADSQKSREQAEAVAETPRPTHGTPWLTAREACPDILDDVLQRKGQGLHHQRGRRS
jgi:hypothetical protein